MRENIFRKMGRFYDRCVESEDRFPTHSAVLHRSRDDATLTECSFLLVRGMDRLDSLFFIE